MRRACLFVLSCLVAFGAAAQAPLRTPPYAQLMAVTVPPPDVRAVEAFTAIRAAVGAKSETGLAALLSPEFSAVSCTADPISPCRARPLLAADRKRAPIERLRLTLCCGGKDDPSMNGPARTEAMFGILDSLLQSSVSAPSPIAGGATCSPPIPAIDTRKAAALAKRLDIDPTALRLASAPIDARPRAERGAPFVATLPKGAIVPLLATAATPAPDGWTALALPSGGVGYAEGVSLDELAPESLCLRNGKDGWKAVLLIGRQS